MAGWKTKAALFVVLGLVIGFVGGVYTWHRISTEHAFAMYGFGDKYLAHFWASELRRDLVALRVLREKGAEGYAKVAAQDVRGNTIMISHFLDWADMTDIQRRTLIRLIEESETYPSVVDASDEDGKRAAEARKAILENLRG